MKRKSSLLASIVLLAGLGTPTWAVDGVVLIDQATAIAGGVTPGDAPGFPVTIGAPGSYRLAGNLTVPDANTNAVEISSDHVTLDLNGFAILGPTDCAGGFPCANRGIGRGIFSLNAAMNITVRNGTVQGMGERGIFLTGDSNIVEYIHARSNGAHGIVVLRSQHRAGSIVRHNIAELNGENGIVVAQGLVTYNVADFNRFGIVALNGAVSHNVATRNIVTGLTLLTDIGGEPSSGGSFIGNVATGSGQNDLFVSSGWLNLGQNLCGIAVCPGAQF